MRTISHNIPREGKAGFFGREWELEELQRRLHEEKQVAIAAVAGMGGAGKTELAVRYAHRNLSAYPGGVCWIDCQGIDAGLPIVDWVREKYQLTPPEELDLVVQVQWCWQHRKTRGRMRDGLSNNRTHPQTCLSISISYRQKTRASALSFSQNFDRSFAVHSLINSK